MLFEIFQTVFKFALLGHTKHPHARRAEAELPLVDARRGIPLGFLDLITFHGDTAGEPKRCVRACDDWRTVYLGQ